MDYKILTGNTFFHCNRCLVPLQGIEYWVAFLFVYGADHNLDKVDERYYCTTCLDLSMDAGDGCSFCLKYVDMMLGWYWELLLFEKESDWLDEPKEKRYSCHSCMTNFDQKIEAGHEPQSEEKNGFRLNELSGFRP